MKKIVTDVVKNSIWFDPRVRKQIYEYAEREFDVIGVGVSDNRIDEKELNRMPFKWFLTKFKVKKCKSIIGKVLRETKTNREMYKLIYKSNPDVIHANDLNALIPAYKAWKKLKRKPYLIYDSHEIFLENPWMNKHRLIKLVWGYYEKKIIKKVDLLICVSESSRNYLVEKYNVKQSVVVTNSVKETNILHEKVYNSNQDVLNQGQFYVGRGYEMVVDAARKCTNKNVKFTLRGYGSLEESIKNKIEKYKLENIFIAKPVKTSELIEYAHISTIGLAITQKISLNFVYSISNKIFEYAAAGLPVIMSDIPEHRILNDKYHFGVILKEDTPEELLKAIDIINNKETYEKMSANAIIMARQTCWEKEFDKLINFIGGKYEN